jgi:hypothetical protein
MTFVTGKSKILKTAARVKKRCLILILTFLCNAVMYLFIAQVPRFMVEAKK